MATPTLVPPAWPAATPSFAPAPEAPATLDRLRTEAAHWIVFLVMVLAFSTIRAEQCRAEWPL